MRICVIGSRNYSNKPKVEEVLTKYQDQSPTIISGGAPGADTLAIDIAKKLGYDTQVFYANWTKWGKTAGPIRNREMLDEGKPDLVIAFRSPGNSSGTDGCIKEAMKRNIQHIIYE